MGVVLAGGCVETREHENDQNQVLDECARTVMVYDDDICEAEKDALSLVLAGCLTAC